MIKNKSDLIFGKFAKERRDIIDALESAFRRIDSYFCVKNVFVKKRNKFFIGGEEFDLSDFENVYLVSFGKAAVKMAAAVSDLFKISEGVVVSNQPEIKCKIPKVAYVEGGHPIPNRNSEKAGELVLNLVEKTTERDLTFVLISGGGSALVEKPLVPLSDLQVATKLLMQAGADIYELNAVRKHLSMLKGGRLLSKIKGKVVSLIVSDVVGDLLDTIASGPTYFDNSTFSDALNVIYKYNLEDKIPQSVLDVLKNGAKGRIPETLKPGSPHLKKVLNVLVATNYNACMAAADTLTKKGYSVFYLGSAIQGEACEVAKAVCGIAWEIHRGRIKVKLPAAIIFGGETTVTVKGTGRGGRNEEFTLASLLFVSNINAIVCSVGTDGIDGTSNAAGAICTPETLSFAENQGIDWKKFLKNNDAHTFFEKTNGLVYTGKTGTNVADLVILIII